MMNITDEEFTAIIDSIKEVDEGIWQLINREISQGNVFSNEFIEDIGALTIKSKFYAMRHSPENT